MAVTTAFIDANVFYSMTLTDIIMQAARDGLIRARWSDAIHTEWTNALLRDDPTRSQAAVYRRRNAMDRAVPDALVIGYEPIMATLTLPHANDRHVLAAAIHGTCSAIVTSNLKHFPKVALAPHGITAVHPDEFLVGLLTRDQDGVLACVAAMRNRLKNPPISFDEHLQRIINAGLPQFADELARLKRRLP